MTYCAETGCGVIVERGRCPAHTREIARARGTTAQQGYGARWTRRSRRFRATYPLCGMRPGGLAPVMSQCHDDGRVTLGEQVDHVEPLGKRPDLQWDEIGNWQTLCRRCHTRKTGRGM